MTSINRATFADTSGSGTGSGTVTVRSGAILEGSGTVGSPLVVQAGGTLEGTVTIAGPAISPVCGVRAIHQACSSSPTTCSMKVALLFSGI